MECQEAVLEYQERDAKQLSRNTKKLLWHTKTVDGTERGYSGIPKSFHVILISFTEHHEVITVFNDTKVTKSHFQTM